MRQSGERTVEALTWAAVVMWLGFALIAHILNYVGLVVMVLGIILLSSAIYQRSRGWHTSLSIWVAGIWMAVFSVIEIVNELFGAINNGKGLNIDLWVYLGIALLSMGLAVVFRFTRIPTPNTASRGRAARYTEDQYAAAPRSRFPRQAQDSLSNGWTPPQQRASWEEPPPAQPARARRQATLLSPPPEPPPPQPARRRTARPADEPSDLESRVEDIIRRSRERRDRDNLRY